MLIISFCVKQIIIYSAYSLNDFLRYVDKLHKVWPVDRLTIVWPKE